MTNVVLEDRMLTRLDIEGFRGLKNFSLENSGRINLVVGRNDAGKTSLLEAIRLLMAGDPRYLRRSPRNRVERRTSNLEQEYRLAFNQSLDGPILHIGGAIGSLLLSVQAEIAKIQQEENTPIDLESEEEDADALLLQASYEAVVTVKANDNIVATIRQPLRSRAPGDFGTTLYRSRRETTDVQAPTIPSLTWLGTNRAEIWAHARRYSHLYRTGGAALLLDVLREIEPRLKSLQVLTSQEDRGFASAVLEVDLGLAHLLPLESMGDGFSSIIAVVSAIGSADGGICLIDEVDNGVHYSLLTSMWRAVASATQKYGSQLWATTHSYDCISAIHEALFDFPDALRVHRLDRRPDGTVTVHTFDHAMLGLALERGLEIR